MRKRKKWTAVKWLNNWYLLKSDIQELIASGYNPKEATMRNGFIPPKNKPAMPVVYPPATPRQIEQDRLMAWIENMSRRAGRVIA
jgi:hypothetical protein